MSKLPTRRTEKLPATQSPIQLYMREISKYPLLNPEEEYELAVQHFEDGDVGAAHRLVTSNLRLVVKIANDFKSAQQSFLDLIQEGNHGLMHAVKKYNPYKGVKLSSYAAWWIRAYILKYLMDNKSQVKIATNETQRKLYYNLEKVRQKLLREFETVGPKELAEALDVREKDVIDMQLRLSSPDVSMDAPVAASPDHDQGTTRGELIPAEDESAEQLVAKAEVDELFAKQLQEFGTNLKGRDKEIFEARLLAEAPLTLQQIGDRYGISRERARQIEANLIKKLRQFVAASGTFDIDVL